MAITRVSGAKAKGGALNTFSTSAIDTTGADLLIVVVGYATAPTLTDSKSNTWTGLTIRTNISIGNRIYYAWNAIVGSGHTFTLTGASIVASLVVQAYAGSQVSGDPFDQQNGHDGGGNATSFTTGSITPGVDNELVIAGICYSDTTSLAIDSGLSIVDQNPLVGGSNYGSGLADIIQTTAGAVNPTWSWTNSAQPAATIASFKAAAAGGSSNWGPFILAPTWNRLVQGA